MKKILLTAAVLIGISGINAQVKDPGVYPSLPNGDKTISLESNWIYSLNTGNYNASAFAFAGNAGGARTMAHNNGKLYVGERVEVKDGETFVRYDFFLTIINPDGTLDERKQLSSDLFKNDAGAYAAYPLNSTRVDSKGNLVMINMTLNIQKSPIQVWATPDVKTTAPTKIFEGTVDLLSENSARVDMVNVYGDVYGDGYIMATVGGADAVLSRYVLVWDIVGGVVSSDARAIYLSELSPAINNGNPNLTLGGAPCAFPINDRLFYVDGQNTYPTKYDMDGQIVDKFEEAPSETILPTSSSNGVVEFTLEGERFLITGVTANNETANFKKNSFAIYKFGANGRFETIKHLYTFPEAGMGGVSNASYVMLPFVNVIDDRNVDIYVFALSNGFGKYRLTSGTVGIEDQLAGNALNIAYVDGQFTFGGATVAKVDVYSIAGVKVAEAKNVSEVAASVANGIYIVKATTLEGNTHTQKVLVK